jgi:hypothetical protein
MVLGLRKHAQEVKRWRVVFVVLVGKAVVMLSCETAKLH